MLRGGGIKAFDAESDIAGHIFPGELSGVDSAGAQRQRVLCTCISFEFYMFQKLTFFYHCRP